MLVCTCLHGLDLVNLVKQDGIDRSVYGSLIRESLFDRVIFPYLSISCSENIVSDHMTKLACVEARTVV